MSGDNNIGGNLKKLVKPSVGSMSLASRLGKLPPQAIELEEAVLGALMLESEAYERVKELLKPESFYKDEHKLIYEAFSALWKKKAPIDMLTVANELRSQGKLEFVGGAYYISELTNRVGTAANIEYHSHIIAQKYIARQLIEAASHITEEAFEETVDVFDLGDTAAMLIQKAVDIKFVKQEQRFAEAVTELREDDKKVEEAQPLGIPTGFSDHDNKCGRFTGGELIIIAARPSMGKTSWALDMAYNAVTRHKKPVAFFSLEMPNRQLAARVLSHDLRVPVSEILNKKISKNIWDEVDLKMKKFESMDLYLNDTADLNVLDLRSKIRKLVSKYGVEEVVIDYLQLMEGIPDRRKDNREQEISYISRNLKKYAKEFDIPIIALSQLSRQVDARKDRRPILSDLRECLPTDEWIDTPCGPVRMKSKPEQIITISGDGAEAAPCEYIYKKMNTVYRLDTHFGSVRTTAKHLILTGSGWKRMRDITARDVIAVPDIIPHANKGVLLHARLLGWLLGNGGLKGTPSLIYRNELHEAVVTEVAKFGVDVRPRTTQKSGNVVDAYLSNGIESGSLPNPLMAWIRSLGLESKTCYDKFIPEAYLGTSDDTHIDLLRGLWESDGTVTGGTAKYATVSEVLAMQVKWLLHTLGIHATAKRYEGIWEVRVSQSDNNRMYCICNHPGRFGKLSTPSAKYVDPAPAIFVELAAEIATTDHRFQKRKDGSFKAISKETMAKIIETNVLPSISISPFMTLPNMRWARVIGKVLLDKDVNVADLHVPGTHCFLSNGIVVHNSGAIEQDADRVLFLYRPEWYGIQTVNIDDRKVSSFGAAELIVAKNRNGRTGTTFLQFDAPYTHFSDWVWGYSDRMEDHQAKKNMDDAGERFRDKLDKENSEELPF